VVNVHKEKADDLGEKVAVGEALVIAVDEVGGQ